MQGFSFISFETISVVLAVRLWGVADKRGYRTYKGIVNYTAKSGYRSDLRAEAVARASAIRQSQRSKKDIPEKKLRGGKAKKATEKESS